MRTEEDCTGLTLWIRETAALIQTNIAWAEMRVVAERKEMGKVKGYSREVTFTGL